MLGQEGGNGGFAATDAARESDQQHRRTVSSPPIAPDPQLYAPKPADRLRAARSQGRLARRALERHGVDWPPDSPGALNAWLLLLTTKPPSWRDPLYEWRELPLTLGEPHEGFYYADPLGFWDEVRRWSVELFRLSQPQWSASEALSLTTLLHVGDDPDRLHAARRLSQPRLLLFLDEPAWESARLATDDVRQHAIQDPHRKGQTYEGFWARTPDGVTVGKAPQHPAAHRLYRKAAMDAFLRYAPLPRD